MSDGHDGLDVECTHINGGLGCRQLGRFELWAADDRVPSRLSCATHLADHIDTMHRFTGAVRVTAARYVAAEAR